MPPDSSSAPAGRGLRCRGCGSSIPFAALAPSVSCPHCHQQQDIPPAVLEELHRYQGEVGDRLTEAEREQQRAAWWAWWYRPGAQPRMWWAIPAGYVLLAGLMLGLHALQPALARALSPAVAKTVVSVAYSGAIVGAVIVLILWYQRRRARFTGPALAPLTASPAICPSCGATQPLLAGEAVERCGHCGAGLMPSAAGMDSGIESADRVQRSATIERYLSERGVVRAGLRATREGRWSTLAEIAGAVVMATVAIAYSVAEVRDPEPPGAMLLVVWALFLLALASAVHEVGLRPARRRRRAGDLQTLADKLAAEVAPGLGRALDWLDAHWAGPYSPSELACGDRYYDDEECFAATLAVDGYPALMLVVPGVRVDLLLAAAVPGLSDGGSYQARQQGKPRELADALLRQGLSLEVQQGGLLGRAGRDSQAVAGLRKGPLAALALRAPLGTLAELARALRAEPAPPLPASHY